MVKIMLDVASDNLEMLDSRLWLVTGIFPDTIYCCLFLMGL